MAAITRQRVRGALATLLGSVTGISAVYTYEPHPDTPALAGTTYAVVDLFDWTETLLGGGGLAPITKAQRSVIVHLVQQSAAVNPTDNSQRASIQASIDTVRDALESKLRTQRFLADGLGRVAFDFSITGGVDGEPSWSTDRTLLDTWLKLQLKLEL